jgi:hypothetical protein
MEALGGRRSRRRGCCGLELLMLLTGSAASGCSLEQLRCNLLLEVVHGVGMS